MSAFARILGLTSTLLFMAACGGGGGDGGGPGGGTQPPPTFTVGTSTSGSGSGTISPGSATVAQGGTASFSVSPAAGSTITGVTGCGGSLSGNTYTTGVITGPCTVTATFSEIASPPPGGQLPVITEFLSSAPEAAPDQPVVFTWTVTGADHEELNCVLDVTGVGPEFFIEDCAGPGMFEYSYAHGGTYLPRLRATDGTVEVSAGLTQSVVSGITLDVLQPQAGAISGPELEVLVSVVSALEIENITANVADRSTELVFGMLPNGGSPRWGLAGLLSLEGLPFGELMLEVVAEDIVGSKVRVIRNFVFAPPPPPVQPLELTVIAPLQDTVTQRWLRVTASCTGDDPAGCEIVVSRAEVSTPDYEVPILLSGMNSVDGDIDMAEFDGKPFLVRIEARDSSGHRAAVRQIYVEGSPHLSRSADYPGLVLDVRDSRVLYRVTGGSADVLGITDSALGSVTTVPLPVGAELSQFPGFLTRFGAIFVVRDTSGPTSTLQLHDWNGGELTALGRIVSHSSLAVGGILESSLAVAGDYAIWNTDVAMVGGRRLMRRDLAMRENLEISSDAGTGRNSVAANGSVALWNLDHQVELFRDGESRLLTSDIELWNTYTATDGERVMYRKHTPGFSNQDYAIILHDGTNEIVLREAVPRQADPGRDFQLVPGWVAYTDVGNLGQTHVWLYGPDGERRQLTFFGNSSVIDRLAPNGEVMIKRDSRRYLVDWDGSMQEVGSALGRAYRLDGRWYVVIGRSVFEVLH